MRFIATIAVTAAIIGGAAAAAATFGRSAGGSPAMPAEHMNMTMPSAGSDLPARELVRARLATAKYANDLEAAKGDGYRILTLRIPGMGYHFLNPSVKGFDVRRPPILVYERHGARWQLGALEWIFPKKPAAAPLKGATYGSFPAACQYADGTFVPTASEAGCAPKSPQSGSPFTFWHPRLVTLHVWIWYPNPAGLYASMNPLVDAFK
jgi:hypothetical protein